MIKPVDVATLLDEGRFSAYQKLLIFGTALTIILDGVDNQLLPNALPSMMAEWGLPRAAFATASAASPFGMMIGGVLGGILGDRLGRKTALLASVMCFAILTIAISFVGSMGVLTLLRFIAGIGLGGAMPNAAALASEYVPRRQRPVAITLTIVCIPLGGVIAGLLAGLLVPTWGWRVLFLAGGLIPVALAVTLFTLLPESPRYLVSRRERWPELRAMLRRAGHQVPDNAELVEPAQGKPASQGSIAQLFAPEHRRDTIGLMGAFCSCLLAIYVGFLWIPAMLSDPNVGFAQSTASYALSLFNFGGVAGALLGAVIIQRVGSRMALLGISGLAVVCSLIMAGMRLDPLQAFGLMMMFTITGGLLNAVQTTMYALAAHVYPTSIRGTGVGTTVAVGRIGNVLASYVGSWALTTGGPPMYFSTWAVAMAVVFISLSVVRRHIPRTVRAEVALASPASSPSPPA